MILFLFHNLFDYPLPQSVEIAVFSSRNILDFTLSTFSQRYSFSQRWENGKR